MTGYLNGKQRKTRTIKQKITLWFSVLLLMLVLVVFILFFLVGNYIVKSNTRERLKAFVEEDKKELEYLNKEMWLNEGEEEDYYVAYQDGYLEIDDDFCSYREGMFVSLYYEGELLYGQNPADVYPNVLPMRHEMLQEIKKEGKKYYTYDVALENPKLEGLWLRGIVSETENIPLLTRSIQIVMLIVPLLAVIAIWGGYLIAYYALRPLEDICEQADNICEGSDLSRRIAVSNESTEIRRLKDTFNQMFERLRISFEAEKQFTSDASHELRTPVSVILAECEYALDETDESEWREALEVISRQGRKMADMIEALLAFTRMEQGTVKLEMEAVNLTHLIEEICAEQEKIRTENIVLHRELERDIILQADVKMIRQMISNLIENAYKYGKEQGNIWVSLYLQNERPVLLVKDDGIGIRREELAFIWNRFYRADNARSDKTSTGLGLSLVKKIAELHHAEAKVVSEIGKGSTFLIFF